MEEEKIRKHKISFLLKVIMFVTAIFLIVQLFPREDKFKYYYQNEKPWRHEFLSAPFDFPIYKEDSELKTEQDSVLQKTPLYYNVKNNILKNQIAKLNRNFPLRTDSIGQVSALYKIYIEQKLDEVYNAGIVSIDEYDRIIQEKKQVVNLVKNHTSTTVDIHNIFTVKSAYNYILNNIPSNLDIHVLKSYDINKYLIENLIYDKEKSEQLRIETIKNISLTSGMVQSGERIIDRGEILNDKTFQILNSLKKETESRISAGTKHNLLLAGQIMLITSLMLLLFLFLLLFRPHTFYDFRSVLFVLLMMLMMVSLAMLVLRYTSLSVYIVPFALLPIIVRTFFDSRTALFVHIITVLLISFMVPNPFEFVLLQITIGMTAVYSLKDLTQRSQLMQASLLIVITYSLIYLSYSLIIDGDINKINWTVFFYFLINGLLLLFAYGLIYIFEKLFGFISNVTLVELSNVNNHLLMRFSEEAPGTFQHSLQVSSLATEAAAKINANSLLVRTGALYHDIGKMVNPMYFIENQSGRVNPLSQLEYDKAAKIIMSHVPDGVKIAQKNNLPKAVIDFIQTHHAESKARYFYNSYKNKYPEVEIDESVFTYTGPKPFSKEMVILMMADAVEAASRSLPEYTEKSIDNLVENIIDAQIAEGSFKNAPITFQQIEKVKRIFKRKLKNIYHSRINYPELVKN